MRRVPVALLGATGVAGRQGLTALADHPWFELAVVAASPRSAGRALGEVVSGVDLPPQIAALVVQSVDEVSLEGVEVVFSTLPSRVADTAEPRAAALLPVFSTASNFRMESDTPLLLAGVNGDHAALLAHQSRARGWKGWVAPGPNCTTVGLAVPLAPLHAAFGVRTVTMTSMQAISGAGDGAPEVAAAVEGNLLPYIAGEEEKVEAELAKILGRPRQEAEERPRGAIEPAPITTSATCTRVPVADGHTLAVAVGFERPVSPQAVIEVLEGCRPFAGRTLPSAPERWIDVRREADRPQPRLDRDAGGGMTTVVGRVRPDPVTGGVRFLVVSHNAVLGAAGGAVLLAEDLLERGLLSPGVAG